MPLLAHVALDPDTIFIQKEGEDSLYRWENDGSKEGQLHDVHTPRGADAWLDSARILHGLKTIVGKDGKPSPELQMEKPIFPKLTFSTLKDGEQVYVLG